MLAILADDLTGALDSAAPFAGRGLQTEVAIGASGISEALAEKPAVLSISLGCREMTAADARSATASALAQLPEGVRLFKKVDSRMKGNIAAELDVTPFTRALVAPAIPTFGRIVEDGKVCGFGVESPISIAARLGSHLRAAEIPDTRTDEDLERALEDAESAGIDLLVGARGLAEALARSMSGIADRKTAEIPAKRALFAIGSRDPITLAQIENLRQALPIDYREAPNGRLENQKAGNGFLTLVQATSGATACPEQDVSAQLAEGIVPSLTTDAVTLLLCGGATAEAVLRRMEIRHFNLIGECLPGLGVAHVGRHCIIAKSGGFGHPDTLKEIATMILRKTV